MEKSKILKKKYDSLPLNWYYDFEHYNEELSKIWSKEWVYVCHKDKLKDQLSYINFKISKFNLLILKDKSSKILAYLNTCRHRGSIICNKSYGKLKNNILVCPYHNWSYNASNGKLLKTSSFKLPKNFKTVDYGLIKIRLKIWNGLIFINLNNLSKWNLKNKFQDYDSNINKVKVENFIIGHTWKKTINCNWKIFWENYSECLHCPNIHPELCDLVPVYGRRLVDIKDDPNWRKLKKIQHPKFQGGLKKGSETWSNDGSAQGHKIKYFINKKNFPGFIYITCWPSLFLVVYIDHIRVVRIIPINGEQTEISSEWLFEKKTILDSKYKKKNVIDFAIKVMKEDSDVCELNQKGVYNLDSLSGILMPEEYDIKKFHDWLRKKLI
tara:strand:+ start:2182 stop:3327 length:1146 start_codon:yes stop_codon:yes gene_type:complete